MKTVLIPLDGSPLGEEALSNGLDHYRKDEVGLVLVLCMDLNYLYSIPEMVPLNIAEIEQMDTKANQHYLDEQVARLNEAGWQSRSVLVYGNPVERILEVVQKEQIDEILLTTHGRSGLARLFLGSVAEGIVRRSPVPVVVVPSSLRRDLARQTLSSRPPGVEVG